MPAHGLSGALLRGAAVGAAVLVMGGCAAQRALNVPMPAAPRPHAHALPEPARESAPVLPLPAKPEGLVPQPQVEVARSDAAVETDEERADRRLRAWVDGHRRIYLAAAPLMLGSVAMCPHNVRSILGFGAKNRGSYPRAFADAAERALHLDDRLRVAFVLPGSGAERAGLREGDVLLAANDQPLPEGEDAERASARLLAAESRGKQEVTLQLLRDEVPMTVVVTLTRACAFGVELGDLAGPAVLADGYRVMVSRPMLDFVRSDLELAYVLAYGFARNLAITVPLPRIGAAIDAARFLQDAPQEFDGQPVVTHVGRDEARADERARAMLVAAGMPVDGYAAFWNRLADEVETRRAARADGPSHSSTTANAAIKPQPSIARVAP